MFVVHKVNTWRTKPRGCKPTVMYLLCRFIDIYGYCFAHTSRYVNLNCTAIVLFDSTSNTAGLSNVPWYQKYAQSNSLEQALSGNTSPFFTRLQLCTKCHFPGFSRRKVFLSWQHGAVIIAPAVRTDDSGSNPTQGIRQFQTHHTVLTSGA
jgi:hypothetical protein